MIIRLGFLVAASVAAFAVKQITVNCSRRQTSVIKDSENGDISFEKHHNEGEKKDHFSNSNYTPEKKQVDDDEEVKKTRSITKPTLNNSHANQNTEEPSLPEHRDHPFRKVQFLKPDDKLDVKGDSLVKNDNLAYETETANNVTEMELLWGLIKELEEKKAKLEGKLLKVYSLKEEESYIAELHMHLKIKTAEIDMLNTNITALQTERKKLQEEINQGIFAKKQLEIENTKIKELHGQMHIYANTTKGHLLMLRQQVSGLQMEEVSKRDAKVERKLKALKELKLEVMELKRMNKELQLERRELEIKLVAAEATMTALSNMTESKMIAKVKQEVGSLRHANEDLLKPVERLQKNRFSTVEELVYQRWVNALLRYEVQSYQTASGKTSAYDIKKSLRPELRFKCTRSNCRQLDSDFNSISSLTSSAESEEFNSNMIDSSSSRQSSINKKPSIVQKINRWRRCMDDSSAVSLRSRSFEGSSRSRTSLSLRSSMSAIPSEVVISKNASDSTTITTSGKEKDFTDSPKTPNFPRIRRVSFSDSVNPMVTSTQNKSKSIEGVLDKKYPMYKDRSELAMDRENAIKEKAEQTRAERLSDGLNLNACSNSEASLEGEKPESSSLTLAPVKKVFGSSDSIEQPTDNSKVETQVGSKIKTSHTEEWDSTMHSVSPNGKNKADTQMVHFVAVFFFLLLMLLVYFLLLTAGV